MLPHDPRPVLRARIGARLLIVGQAPGRRVHETGVPWNDPSGDTLRRWLHLDRETFYDESRIAIVPMGFCWPGTKNGADQPPRPECRTLWHRRLLALLPEVRLTLLIGAYAHAWFLGPSRAATTAETVRTLNGRLPRFAVLPHPSPRNRRWLALNPWFEAEHVPNIAARVRAALAGEGEGAAPMPLANNPTP